MAIVVASLPKILVGPVLRRVTSTSVAVWVALRANPGSISLDVLTAAGASVGGSLDTQKVQVGASLHIVLLELEDGNALTTDDHAVDYDFSFRSDPQRAHRDRLNASFR